VREHLVVVDLQHVFGDASSEWFTPRFAEIVPRIAALVSAFEPRVTFTRFVAPSSPAGSWQSYYAQFPWALQPATAPLYQLVEPFAGRETLDCATFGKWGAALSRRLDGDDMLLCGVSTDCCVISTALPAADAGVRVRVVADACAGASDETHEQALAVMALYAPLIEVVESRDVLAG